MNDRTRRVVHVAGAALLALAVICAVIAPWLVGPDSGRLAGTAAVLAIAGTLTLLTGLTP